MTAAWMTDAARMPIAFAQVREDPRVDLSILNQLDPDSSGVMIASGGCTTAALIVSGRLARLHLVDANPAQLALTRVKIHLLSHATPTHRCELLGHAPLAAREKELASLLTSLGLQQDALGPLPIVAELGPDYAGRYELLFSQLRLAMGRHADRWPAVLMSADAAAVAAPNTALGSAMDDALDHVMSLDNLITLFGPAATQNRVHPFARHFADRTRRALARLPTHDNPFLWQLLVGRFPQGVAFDWLTMLPPIRMPELTWSHAPMDTVLANAESRFDFVHLSNILDWLSPAEATELLRVAWRSLRPGGLTIIRQLNSSLDLPALGASFDWLIDQSDALHASDRSFFYRHLHLGIRRE